MQRDVKARFHLIPQDLPLYQGSRELYVLRQRRIAKRFILLTLVTLLIGLYLAFSSP